MTSLAVIRPALARGALASATISTALLLPHERIARTSLTLWAERLDARLTGCREAKREIHEFSAAVSDVANNVALIAAHQGRSATARALCEAQIRWQFRLARRSRTPTVAARALQPWINLGRLEVLSGAWESALTRFGRLLDLRDGRSIDLGPGSLGRRECENLSSTRDGLRQHLSTVYVVDSLKALLLNQRFARITEFASRLELDHPAESIRLASEASIIAACRLGDNLGASDAAARAGAASRGWDRVVFELRTAEVLACGERLEQSAAILSRIAAVTTKVSCSRKSRPDVLPAIGRIAATCGEVGLVEVAVDLARGALDAARVGGDEALEIESLRTLARYSPTDGLWQSMLMQLETNTDYARYRRGGPDGPGSCALHQMYDRLLDFLSE